MDFLAEIPEKLEAIQRLSHLHRYSVQLHMCADGVIVAIFVVLERIVEQISRTWRFECPMTLMGSGDGSDKLVGKLSRKKNKVVSKTRKVKEKVFSVLSSKLRTGVIDLREQMRMTTRIQR